VILNEKQSGVVKKIMTKVDKQMIFISSILAKESSDILSNFNRYIFLKGRKLLELEREAIIRLKERDENYVKTKKADEK